MEDVYIKFESKIDFLSTDQYSFHLDDILMDQIFNSFIIIIIILNDLL